MWIGREAGARPSFYLPARLKSVMSSCRGARSFLLAALVLLQPIGHARAQTGQGGPPDAGRANSARTQTGPARRALEAGRVEEALAIANRTLSQNPADGEATAVKIEALLASANRTAALDAYEAWHRVSRTEQDEWLTRIARSELRALADQAETEVEALEALARSGDAEARKALTALAWSDPPTRRSWPAVVALAKTGDEKAGARILQAVRESTGGGKLSALQALGAARVKGAEAVLREALQVRDPMVQAAAAQAAAALDARSLVPDLQKVATGGEQFGRFAAAVALARLGGTGGEELVKAGLESPALDARLQAASARKARGDRAWSTTVAPLLENPEGLVRFHAAELLLDTDRDAALAVLLKGTVDPNPAVRIEVARILTADERLDTAQLRRLLRDGIDRVRLQASAALLRRGTGTGRR